MNDSVEESRTPRFRVSVGPAMPGWGSWDWVGTFLLDSFAPDSQPFSAWERTDADLVIVVKQAPPVEWLRQVAERSAVVYCPIDWYGHREQIEADADRLSYCSGIWVHCHRLEPLLRAHSNVHYIDHPLKFAIPTRSESQESGRLLWVGVRTNLPALATWLSVHRLPAPLDVLTNPAQPGCMPSPSELGFPSHADVRLHEWSAGRHLDFAATALAALDIKDGDFRSRHKPPAKAYDFVASGIPVALNPGGSAAEALANLGLEVPSPLDPERWLSEEYAGRTRTLGERLWREMNSAAVAERVRELASRCLESKRAEKESVSKADWSSDYQGIASLASQGDSGRLRAAYRRLLHHCTDQPIRALARNDMAVLDALSGDGARALAGVQVALELDPNCRVAHDNLASLGPPRVSVATRIAIASMLFNWPSTGGGNVHSAELACFLARAGYEVAHFIAEHEPWGIGRISLPTPHPVVPLRFRSEEWTRASIIERFRMAFDRFGADWVVLTDSWNFKPLLARAVGRRPYVLRLQAMECLCPLNNVRLLSDSDGRPAQCTRHQLATPEACRRCVRERAGFSGPLHKAERDLAGFDCDSYRPELFQAFARATAVLAVNPLSAAMVEPYCRDVRVITAGMDPARFPRPRSARIPVRSGPVRLLFAGLTSEWMKGFTVLLKACRLLWAVRNDFELIVTDEKPADATDPFIDFIGWQSQADLPRHYGETDIVAVPTVAQEALGRTAVEAMAAGKPVVASRIGGLMFTVLDGATGLLCRAGDPEDLAAKLAQLLDDRDLRQRLGASGRMRFEAEYSWPVVVERHYRPLFGPALRTTSVEASP